MRVRHWIASCDRHQPLSEHGTITSVVAVAGTETLFRNDESPECNDWRCPFHATSDRLATNGISSARVRTSFQFLKSDECWTPPSFRCKHRERILDATVSPRHFRLKRLYASKERRTLYFSGSLGAMLRTVARQSLHNKRLLRACGQGICYHCTRVVNAKDCDFVRERRGDATAWCPACGIDSIVPSLPLTRHYITLINWLMF
jgi:hypothetical protein